MAVVDSVGEGIGQGVAGIQGLHGGQAVVEHIRVRAVGVEGQGTVRSGGVGLGNEGHDVMDIRVRGVGQGAVDRGGKVFHHAAGGCGDRRDVVGSVDGHGQGVGGRTAVSVADGVDEGVGDGFARAKALYGGQAVIEDIGVGAVGVQGQGTVKPGSAVLRKEGHSVVDIRVLWVRQGSCGGDLCVFGDGGGSRGDRRDIVGSVDGHGQGVGGRAAVSVTDGIGEHVGGGFSGSEPLYERGRIVQRIGVGAVGIQRQGAVGSRLIQFWREAHDVVGIRVMGRGQDSRCHDLRVLSDGSGCCGDCRCVVGPVDGYGQRVGGGSAVIVRDGVGEHVGGGFPGTETLDDGRSVVERIRIGAVGIQRQGSVRSGGIRLRREGYGVVSIRVPRCRQCS